MLDGTLEMEWFATLHSMYCLRFASQIACFLGGSIFQSGKEKEVERDETHGYLGVGGKVLMNMTCTSSFYS